MLTMSRLKKTMVLTSIALVEVAAVVVVDGVAPEYRIDLLDFEPWVVMRWVWVFERGL